MDKQDREGAKMAAPWRVHGAATAAVAVDGAAATGRCRVSALLPQPFGAGRLI